MKVKTAFLLFAMGVTGITYSAPYPFPDDFESGMSQWMTNGTWGLTTASSRSPATSATDSPGAFYTNNTDAALTMASGMDLSGAVRPALRYYTRYSLEPDYDFAYVEISDNGGSSWTTLGSATGNQPAWSREQIALNDFIGASDVRVRFRLVTDGSVVRDGVYVDDVFIGESPEMIAAMSLVASQTQVHVSWTPSADLEFASYRILRALGTNPVANAYRPMATIIDPAVTSWTDVAVSPKTPYTYALSVFNTNELESLRVTATVQTPPGMDFPFLDNGEGGGTMWSADTPWALSTNAAWSGTTSWTDSPDGHYTNSVNAAMTLVAPVSLAGKSAPVFSYLHRYHMLAGDSGLVEISTNNGAAWMTLASYTSASSGWRRVRHDLSGYTNASQVLVRFRLTTDASGTADGWWIDDVSLSESPDTVPAPVIDQVTSHTMRLNWGAADPDHFGYYAIHRSTQSGVTFNSPMIARIEDPLQTSYVDSGLALDTVYYYRVYAVNRWETHSLDSINESQERTLNNPAPFVENFEGSLPGWNLSGSWGLTDEAAADGTYSLTDSPYTIYSNSVDASAQTAVDLRGLDWPVLKFSDKHVIGSGDRGYLEISTDGSGWWRAYGVMGTRTNWMEQVLDLSEYKNIPNLRIRFRFVSDGSGQADGWYIDALSVTNHQPDGVDTEIHERFDAAPTSWLAAGWHVDTNTIHEGTSSLHNNIPGVTYNIWGAHRMLHYSRPLDLSGHANPQLTYWLNLVTDYRSYYYAQVSTNGGAAWINVDHFGQYGNTAGWARRQLDLTAYRQTNVLLRFYTSGVLDNHYWNEILLDKMTLKDIPAGVVLEVPVPGLKTVDLSWSEATIGADFKEYRIYRSTTAGVTWNSTLLGIFTNLADRTMTDTGLSIGATYYYGVYVVDTNDMYSAINTRSATTVPVNAPFFDPMDNLDQWDSTGAWGADSSQFVEGSASLTHAPGGEYPPGQDTYILTSVNLQGLDWPVLKFSDRHVIGSGDRGYLEISTDGSGWWRAYGVMGTRTNWMEQTMDLISYKNTPNLRIRFRFISDGSGQADGWYIDALSVTNHQPEGVDTVIYERFDAAPTNWLAAGWHVDTNTMYEGTSSLHNNIPGVTHTIWGAHRMLHYSRPLDLSGHANPQLTYWLNLVTDYRSYYYAQVSTNGGAAWINVDHINQYGNTAGWARRQLDLTAYRKTNVLLRFYTSGALDNHYWNEILLDKMTLKEIPAGVVLEVPVPGLKTMDLSWSEATIGADFKEYRIYRSTTAGVTWNSTLLGIFTNLADRTMTDTGLSIGATYYYGVYVVDSNDMYSAVNTRTATTIPVNAPFFDPMDNLGQWDSTGTWGPDSSQFMEGAASLTHAPGGEYPASQDTYILTSVNLQGLDWPVLKFSDRHVIGSGDRGYLEISTDGSGWWRAYGVMGTRTHWMEQELDLISYKNTPNLRIRFRFVSDGSGQADGWYIDALSVTNHQPEGVDTVIYERFDAAPTNWLAAGWHVDTNTMYEGTSSLHNNIPGVTHTIWGAHRMLHYIRPLDLTGHANPQLTYWLNLVTDYRSYYYAQVSTNGGAAWINVDHINQYGNTAGWARRQLDLTAYRQTNVLLRFYTSGALDNHYWNEILLDKMTLKDIPAGVVLDIPVPGLKTVDLSWSEATIGADFKEYRIYRSTAAGVNWNSTLVGVFTNLDDRAMTDTNLIIGATYHYGVFVVDTNDMYSAVSIRAVTTVPAVAPFCDGMDDLSNWNSTGAWGADATTSVEGGASVTDSPDGDYLPNTDSHIQTSVDIRGLDWPVLSFWDKHGIGSGDRGYIELSADGSAWWRVYGVLGNRTNWVKQVIDLSPYKNAANLRIKFRFVSDGSGQADGWHIDAVCVTNHTRLQATDLYDRFEGSLTNWLNAGWWINTNTVWEGEASLRNNIPEVTTSGWGAHRMLTYAGELDLSGHADPRLTYWLNLAVDYRQSFAVQVSTDGGVGWTTVDSYGQYGNTAGWVRRQASLSAYRTTNVRVRVYTGGVWDNQYQNEALIDDFGIGDPAPGAPGLKSPAIFDMVAILRPELEVWNAVDYQTDPLTYAFEVYADEDLSNLVAQVPSVASGSRSTSWQVDVNLDNNAQYWWRARASDGSNAGPWMASATFFVNETNAPPYVVAIAGPPKGATLRTAQGVLYWFPTTDPDVGDQIIKYHIQIDEDADFSSVLVNDVFDAPIPPPEGAFVSIGRPLYLLDGYESLGMISNYYWRIRAQDSRFSWSAWSAPGQWFIFGVPPPDPYRIQMNANGTLTFYWDVGTENFYVWHSATLATQHWQVIAGPLDQNQVTVSPSSDSTEGYYRITGD